MPNHSPEHMDRLVKESAAQRRVDKLARLISTSPHLSDGQVRRLQDLLRQRFAGGAR